MATRTWTGGAANDNWSATANWGGAAAPVAADDIIFAGSTRLSPVNDLTSGLSFNSITFASGAGAFSITGNNLGMITNGITNSSSNTQAMANRIDINTAMTVTTGASGAITLSGSVAGNTITKAGLGTLTLSGSTDNDSASATVNAGTLVLAKTSSTTVHALGGSLTINSGGTCRLGGTGGDQFYYYFTLGITINAGGTFDLFGLSETVAWVSGAGVIDNTSATPCTLTLMDNSTFSGVIKNTSGALSVALTSGTLTLSGQNSYTGTTSINGGTAVIGGGRPLGFSTVTVASGATLSVSGLAGLAGLYFQRPSSPSTANHDALETLYSYLSGLTVAQGNMPITMTMGDTGTGFPSPYNSSMNNVESIYSGRFTVATTGLYTFNTRSDDGSMIWIDGAVVVNNNFYQPVTTRTGTITLTAGIVYNLVISFYQGGGGYGLNAQISGAGNTTMVDINTTNVPSLTPDAYIETLSGAGSVVLTGGSLILMGAASTTFSGVISGAGGLRKMGAGTLTLTRQNTYTGPTTITTGTLKLRNSWRYLRFTSTAWKGGDLLQISELQFFASDVWTAATTATNPGGTNPSGEEPDKANDNTVGTKWVDLSRLALVYDYSAQVLFDEYNWATANDTISRDPLRWIIAGSHDNATWFTLDDRSGADQAVTDTRQVWVAPLAARFSGWPLGNGTNVLPTGTALTVSATATLDLGGLVQTVASATFVAGTTLRVDLNTGPATKNGRLTVTGTATINGVATVGLNTLPVLSTAYTVLSAATLIGTFQPAGAEVLLVGRTFGITYPTNTVVLSDAGDPRNFLIMFA